MLGGVSMCIYFVGGFFSRRGNAPCGVQDRDQIRSQTGGHAESLSLEDDESEGQEHAPEEEKGARECQDEFQFLERFEELERVEGLLDVLQSRLNSQVGNDEQTEDKKRANSHGPAKTNFRDEMVHHDRENDTSQARAAGHDS